MTETQRSRTFTWSDPAEIAALLGTRSGLELLTSMANGEIPAPPIMHLIDVEGLEVSEGKVAVSMTPQEFHYNPLGSVHGGVIATLLDTVTGCAVHSTLPAGVGYTTLDLTTKYLRPITVRSGTVRGEGVVISRGRTTALAEGRLLDGRGRQVAHAISTCQIFDIPDQVAKVPVTQ